MKKSLDFICIGAAKSGTDTLFELIRNHPRIYIPPDKEVPFFSDDDVYNSGVSKYMKTFFSKVDDKTLVGTVTPQYMSASPHYTREEVCRRIHQKMPDVKIIVMLRHPVMRTFSHYKMRRRLGYAISDPFDVAVDKLVSQDKGKPGDAKIETISFVTSEYGQTLSNYYKLFPKKNILVLYTDDLRKDPSGLIKRVFKLLGIDAKYTPEDVNQRSNVGGGSKIKYMSPGFLRKVPYFYALWRKIPKSFRDKVYMRVTRWNIKPDNEKLDPSSPAYKKLVDYYAPDIKKLEKLTGKKVPWKDWS